MTGFRALLGNVMVFTRCSQTATEANQCSFAPEMVRMFGPNHNQLWLRAYTQVASCNTVHTKSPQGHE